MSNLLIPILHLKSPFYLQSSKVFFKWSAIFLLMLCVCYKAFQLKELLSHPLPSFVDSGSTSEKEAETIREAVKSVRVDPQEIVSWFLFGQLDSQPNKDSDLVETGEPVEVIPTKLSLDLEGLVFSNRASASKAIISHQGRLHQYGEGDKIPGSGNIIVSRVDVNRVIINNNGNLEALFLYSDSGLPSSKKIDIREGDVNIEEDILIHKKETLNETEKITYLSDFIGFSMFRENGVLQGFKVNNVYDENSGGFFGFLPGDIVIGVNDIMLDTPKKSMDLFRIIRSNSKASFLVKRENQQVVINVSVDERS